MQQTNTQNIENNLITNLVRIFTAYGWDGEGAPKNYTSKIATIKYGLYNGDALGYTTHLSMIIQARNKDHNWGLYTPVFVEGVQALLKSYCKRNKLYDKKGPISKPVFNYAPHRGNIFTTLPHGIQAIERLEKYGKTNIRYSAIEEFGEKRVLSDLRKLYPSAKLRIAYEEHEPDQFRDWMYDEGLTKMTVMYPVLPLVFITKE